MEKIINLHSGGGARYRVVLRSLARNMRASAVAIDSPNTETRNPKRGLEGGSGAAVVAGAFIVAKAINEG